MLKECCNMDGDVWLHMYYYLICAPLEVRSRPNSTDLKE